MTKISNKGQSGPMITLAVSTIAIILIILMFAIASTFFTSKIEIEKKSEDFSSKAQTGFSVLSLLKSEYENSTLSEMIRISKINSIYREKTERAIFNSFSIYEKWLFRVSTNIAEIELGDYDVVKTMVLPDFAISKKIEAGVK